MWGRRLGIAFAIIATIFLLAAIVIPNPDGPHRRQHLNEAITVGTLRQLNKLQTTYAATFGTRGFACELQELHPVGASADRYDDEWGYLINSEHRRLGYL